MRINLSQAINTSVFIVFICLIAGCFEKPEDKFDVQLHWQSVTEFIDGSDITSIAHYEIHYGPAIDQLDSIVYSRNPNLNAYVITDLPAGEYYFSMLAVADNGIKSELSAPTYFLVSE